MDRKYACYCGLYCLNCPVKGKVEPAAKVLYHEMDKLGFSEIISYFPDGEKFWSFLKTMTEEGICLSCKEGSGNPDCRIRKCATQKNKEMCALCENYPCVFFTDLFQSYPTLAQDNEILRQKGWKCWEALQDGRQADGIGFSYKKRSPE